MTETAQYQIPFKTGESLRDSGMNQAEAHANKVVYTWSEQAYLLLQRYARLQPQSFLCENFRSFCEDAGLQTPPSLRAYGSVIIKGMKIGLIKSIGTAKVKNSRAHCANASVLVSLICQH